LHSGREAPIPRIVRKTKTRSAGAAVVATAEANTGGGATTGGGALDRARVRG
jgi:hypothetical protein